MLIMSRDREQCYFEGQNDRRKNFLIFWEFLPHTEATFCWLEDVNGANCFL